MHADRRSKAYELGAEGFFNFAVENLINTTHIRCPCVKCGNIRLFGVGIIRDHLYFNGIDQSYKIWIWHGEPWEWTTNASRNVEEDEQSRFYFVSEEVGMDDNDLGNIGFDPYEFANVIGDGDQPLYPSSSKYTMLSALVKLYNLKVKHGMSDVCFTELLIVQGDLLPEGNTLPSSMYEGKKILSALGMSYEKIHACPNDYILYRKDYEDSTNCPTCGVSRWKEGKDAILKEGVPAMVVWYFPQIPRVCWKKKSKFFDLEIIGTLLEILGKNKDEIAAQLDLLNMGVKTDLQPKYGERHTHLPPGPWNLSRAEKTADSRLLGLKYHDCHTLMQQLLLLAIRFVLEMPARYMKVLKGYVQKRARPKGCIAERYIAEEAVEFCTEHLSDVSTVGVPLSQKMGVSKPLSGCTVNLVDRDLLNQAHLYVLENTEEVLPDIEEYMIHIKTTYPKFRKRTKWLQDKHNSTFIQWLHFKVQSELNGEEHNGISENWRWLAAGPSMAVPSYRSYLINEIWDLDYHKFRIPVLRCDWVDNTSGLVVDELGYTLVDLSEIGHRNDQFVMASQDKQVFYVDDLMHRGWSVVLSMPNRKYNDVIGDDVLGDTRIECEPLTRGIPNVDTFEDLVSEFGNENIRVGCEDIWID
ncbi:hypothetical protein L3X38_032682 [Prunus dulcis]|uniref:Transposable element protein n=1 Tax=Prunus dulcis TaxID=3755 RepID=A0AAD4VEJ5_PRUDU|nr:hypothetical protein L3X38_032682 [Prunus dulcis]